MQAFSSVMTQMDAGVMTIESDEFHGYRRQSVEATGPLGSLYEDRTDRRGRTGRHLRRDMTAWWRWPQIRCNGLRGGGAERAGETRGLMAT